ncbi:right-handed parallel beta-helix repeat-containing protein [Pseudomonadota bacterium]
MQFSANIRSWWNPINSIFTRLSACSLAVLLFPATINAQSVPESIIPIGDGPYALDVSADGASAVVSLLFPAEESDPNLFWVDLASETVTSQYRFGNRLFRIGAIDPALLKTGGTSSLPVALVNGDVDLLTLVELESGNEICGIPTGQNPSNVFIIQTSGAPLVGDTTNLAIVTNGTGGSLSFLDLDTCNMIGETEVGGDPRDVTMAPEGRYLYVVLRHDNTVVTIDLELLDQAKTESNRKPGNTKDAISSAEVSRVKVGQDPSSIQITPDGTRAVVSNLTNNTVSLLSFGVKDSPRLIRDPKTGSFQFPVGIQPTSIAITPDSKQAFVANAGSSWVTIIDLEKPEVLGVVTIQQPGEAIASAAAAVAVTPDGKSLLVAESGNGANLLVYSIENLLKEALPPVEVPDEPATVAFLERAEGESCGFYTTGLTLQEGATEGTWGLEVKTTEGNRLLEGGINLGGAFEEDAKNPGFGAFNIANRGNENQIVKIKIDALALPTPGFSTTDLGVSVQVFDSARDPVSEEVIGSDFLELEVELEPGFYIVRIKSRPGSPRGTFLMDLLTSFVDRPGGGFQGGANVGGFITRRENGNSTTAFAGFCISQTQDMAMRTEAGTTRGEKGAGSLILTIRNRQREIVEVVSNSTPPPPPVEPPPPPSMNGLVPDIYVDASASPGGAGSAGRPFKSITEAIGKAAKAGDVILVRPGTYSPSTTGEVLPIGSPGPGLNKIPANVKLIGSGSAVTIIDAEKGLRDGNRVNTMGVGSDGVRIAGFTVRQSSAVGIFILNADNVKIDSNYFVGNGRFAVGASGTGGLVLSANVARANNETGFSVANARKINVSNPPTGCPAAFGACIINNIANEHSRDGFLMTTGGDYHVLNNSAYNNGISGIEVNNRNNSAPLNSVVRGNLTSNNGGVLFPFSGTGILITEFAHAVELSGNQAYNNRPGGIAVFEDSSAELVEANIIDNSKQNGLIIQKRSTVETLIGNQVTKSGLAGIFVENDSSVGSITFNEVNRNGSCKSCTAAKGGIAILGGSFVDEIQNNSFDRNSLGMQIANTSSAESVMNSSFNDNADGGVLVRQGSSIPDFNNNSVLNNRGAVSIAIDSSTGNLSQVEVSAFEGIGVALYQAAEVTLQQSTISNSGLDGIAIYDGSSLTLTGVDVSGNGESGVLASGAGSTASVEGSTIRNNAGYGLNAQSESSISCSGSNTVSGNGQGATLGNVSGCN